MDWKLLLDYIKALIWPTVTVTLGVIFRKQLVKLTHRVNSVETPVGTVTFENQADAITQEAAVIEHEIATEILDSGNGNIAKPATEEVVSEPIITPRYSRALSKYAALSESDPTGAILGAWREVEESVARAIPHRRGASPDTTVRALSNYGLLPEHLTRLTNDLRLLRNRVAHSGDVALTVDGAKSYVTAAQTVIDALDLARTPQARHLHYERTVFSSILQLGIPVEEVNRNNGCDFFVGKPEGTVGIIVKYRQQGMLDKEILEREKVKFQSDAIQKILITNAALSDVVLDFNAHPESNNSSIREVIQWRDQEDNDLLIRALGRAGVIS